MKDTVQTQKELIEKLQVEIATLTLQLKEVRETLVTSEAKTRTLQGRLSGLVNSRVKELEARIDTLKANTLRLKNYEEDASERARIRTDEAAKRKKIDKARAVTKVE